MVEEDAMGGGVSRIEGGGGRIECPRDSVGAGRLHCLGDRAFQPRPRVAVPAVT